MNRILVLICIAILAASCVEHDDFPGKRIRVRFDCSVPATRSGIPDDRSVNSLDILFFRAEDGAFDAYTRVENDRADMDITAGIDMRYYVMANFPKGMFEGISNESEYLRTVLSLSDIDGSMPMSCSGSGKFNSDQTLEVYMHRLLCRIELNEISTEFMSRYDNWTDVTLDAVYLINVNGTILMSGAYGNDGLWFNKSGHDLDMEAQLSGLIHSYSGRHITDVDGTEDSFCFFCMPNPTDNSINWENTPYWSPRNTRLVVEMTIMGKKNYYPVTLPAVHGNRRYTIERLILLGPGSSHPDIPVDRKSVSFAVSVTPWVNGNNENIYM